MYSYGGCFNYQNVQKNTTFGKYCLVASNIFVYNRNHPVSGVSTHPMFYNSALGCVTEDKVKMGCKTIGNDVWLGQNCIILPSVVEIENSAVIGAGAVVTKNVPPYAIVAGTPARIIKYRFEKDIIEKLEALQWWNLPQNKIKESVDVFCNVKKYIEIYSSE